MYKKNYLFIWDLIRCLFKKSDLFSTKIFIQRKISPSENSKIAEGQEVVKLDFMILHKLSAKVSRGEKPRKRNRKGERERSTRQEILIIPFTRRPMYPTSLFSRNLIARGKTISVGIRVSGDLECILYNYNFIITL